MTLYTIYPTYGKPKLTGLDSVTIEVPDSIFIDPKVGDEIEVKIDSFIISTEVTS